MESQVDHSIFKTKLLTLILKRIMWLLEDLFLGSSKVYLKINIKEKESVQEK